MSFSKWYCECGDQPKVDRLDTSQKPILHFSCYFAMLLSFSSF